MIKIDIENSIAPAGFAFTGEYRKPERGEWHSLTHYGECVAYLEQGGHLSISEHPILRKAGRWRAKRGERYYYITDQGKDVRDQEDLEGKRSQAFYDSGNYFQTKGAAQECAMLIRDTFINFWKSKGLDL